jgi:hypothetical protein
MNRIEETITSLLDYCRRNDWAGFDPYDALNSRLFTRSPFAKSRVCRIAFTQILKRLPINVRPLLSMSCEQNPKALALFLMAFVMLEKNGILDEESLVRLMIDRLEALRSPNTTYWCWGYSFPWQTRKRLVPLGTPNLVCTVFVANSLLDAYEAKGDDRCLRMAASAADYILDELYWTEGDSVAGFSYPLPSLRSRVHNANFLGAALLCRVSRYTGERKFLEPALRVSRHSAAQQHQNGSWDYGEWPTQKWVDNFHTGFNLGALQSMCRYAGTEEFQPHIRRGLDFYRKHFFREDGAPRYFHDRTYPIDIHSVAQSIITLLEFKDLDGGNVKLALSVFDWAMKQMRDEEGFFYYQVLPFYKVRIPYMRWSQAWMLMALATLFEETDHGAVADLNSKLQISG